VSSIDLFPTVVEMAGARPPADQPVDGVSLVPLLRGREPLGARALFNFRSNSAADRPGGVAVRAGDWKLVRWYETNASFPREHELYDLRSDVGERHDLAPARPDKVRELRALVDGFIRDTGALEPRPNPAWVPEAGARARRPQGGAAGHRLPGGVSRHSSADPTGTGGP
jgi:arylsulfatase A-like enzyme